MAFNTGRTENYIGSGITLPLKISNGTVPLDSGVELIRSSIRMILFWLKGTRFFLTEFGSKMEELLEEPNDNVLSHLCYTIITDALNTWEKRIEVMDVNISIEDRGKLKVSITYKIITSQRLDTFTFPFYSEINN